MRSVPGHANRDPRRPFPDADHGRGLGDATGGRQPLPVRQEVSRAQARAVFLSDDEYRRQALRRRRGRGGRFNLAKRPRHPRRQEVGQKAERRVRVPAVETRDPNAGRGLAPVAAVARKRTATAGMARTRRKNCIAPPLRDNVRLGGKVCFVANLHPTAPGPAERHSARATSLRPEPVQ